MYVTFGFRQIEAERYGPVHLQPFTGLDGEALFVQVEQFAQIHNHLGLRAIETGVNRRMEFLANTAASLSVGSPCNWIRQSENASIHGCLHINSRIERKGARSIGVESDGFRRTIPGVSQEALSVLSSLRKNSDSSGFWEGHEFTACGKTPIKAGFGKGTSLLVPLSRWKCVCASAPEVCSLRPQPARVSAGYPRSRAFRALGSHARVNLGNLLEGRANSSAQLRSFPRKHPELTLPFDAISCEVLVIDRKNDGKRFALRQIHECGVGKIHGAVPIARHQPM